MVQVLGRRPSPGERSGATRWYRCAKATKRGATEYEGSEFTDSTVEVGEPTPGDPAEGSGDRAMGLFEGQMMRTLGRDVISTRQEKLATLAQIEPKVVLTTLAHHIDEVWLREAYRRTRKDAAAGVDGVTAADYEVELEANLKSLLERFKSGRYRAPAVRRVHLPKPGTKKTRPIGIPTLEDKVLQRAVLMVLEPIYEQDFLDCSYGFRPGRSAHQALDALWRG